MYFELVIPGDPVAKQRPRMWKQGGKARTYTPTETRHYENKIRMLAQKKVARDRRRYPIQGPIEFSATFHLRPPARGKPHAMPATDPRDVDNLAKCLLDGLEKAGVYVNDRQIVRMSIEKVYTTTRPRAELHLHTTGGNHVAPVPPRNPRTSVPAHPRGT